MGTLRDQACIVGVGETPYCRAPGSGRTHLGLLLDACRAAIRDAGLAVSDIDAIMTPIMGATAEELAANLGIRLRYGAQSAMGGASAVAGLQTAAMAVACGVAENVLVPAGWNGYSATRARDV